MAESAGQAQPSPKAPVKGILKKGGRSSKKGVGIAAPGDGEKAGAIQWDELNIMMTEHPEGKDYGHMKIDEPKTPYNRQEDSGDEGEGKKTDFPDELAQRVTEAAENPRSSRWEESSGSEVDPDDLLTEEQREHKRKFREWRKKHYDEFYAVKKARERRKRRGKMDENDESDDEVEGGGGGGGEGETSESMDTATTT